MHFDSALAVLIVITRRVRKKGVVHARAHIDIDRHCVLADRVIEIAGSGRNQLAEMVQVQADSLTRSQGHQIHRTRQRRYTHSDQDNNLDLSRSRAR